MEPDQSFKTDIFIEINGKIHKIQAILDTGASITVINKKIYRATNSTTITKKEKI